MTESNEPFDDFVRGSSGMLMGYARALTGNPHDALDLVQEALTRMAERWDRQRFDDPAAYTRTVMVRLNIDRLRRIRREFEVSRRGRARESYDMAPPEPMDGWLVTALIHLSPNQRTALALRFVDDLDVNEIARRMHCGSGTARSHLSRGLARLRAVAPARVDEEQLEQT